MARQPREASAADVRQWALDENWTDSNGNAVGERGRFSSELVEAFNKAHRRNNVVYQGGGVSSGNTSGNSRSTQTASRPANRTGNTGTSTRRTPSGSTRQPDATPAPRPRQRATSGGDVRSAVISQAGAGGMSEQQMEQFSRMLADANAVTGVQNELTIIRIAPAAVA